MPTFKELTIRMEDKPGVLGKFSHTLADRVVNILAFQAAPSQGTSVVRMVVDNPTGAKKVLESQHLDYTETEVASAKLMNRPGELSRAASQLGAANINIEYAYSGVDPSNSPMVFFGVKNVSQAVAILDKLAAAA